MKDKNLQQLIPQHKSDIVTAEKLKNYTIDEIREIVPELLAWLQDINWLVAKPVAEYLLSYTDEIAEEILQILQGEDEVWKYWIIAVFGEKTNDNRLKDKIISIAKYPTESEKKEEVDTIAQDIIETRGW